MSELNINNLPHELVTNVFQFLDVVNLKKATLVCKLWNNLIENSCRWSLKLHYDHKQIFQDSEQKMNFILTTNRKFGAIKIWSCRLTEKDQIHKIFQRHGFNVFKLILWECGIGNQTTLAELLNLTPNLKHAEVYGTNLYGLSDVTLDQVLPDLQKLKTLNMWDSDQRVIGCFRKSKLTAMSIVEPRRSDHYVVLVDFLLRQDMLTSLTVSNVYSVSQSILVEMGKLSVSIPFRLTQLNITCHKGDALSYDHLLTFVKSQAESLTEIKMYDIPSSLLECVFAMPNLNTLTVLVRAIPRNNNCYERLTGNCNVRTLKLYVYGLDSKHNIQYFGSFLQKLPNIRSLIFPYYGFYSKENALVMTQNLSKVESVTIGGIDQVRSIDFVRFSNLKALHIECLWVKSNWNEFTKFHSRLTELTIAIVKETSFFTSDDIDQITTNVHLQLIRLGVGFVADEQFFEIIRNKCTNLKVLDLHRSCVSYGLSLSYNVGIDVLRLCDD